MAGSRKPNRQVGLCFWAEIGGKYEPTLTVGLPLVTGDSRAPTR
jgi:hypothetical protein